MRDRFAGQALIEKTVADQASVGRRGWLSRALGFNPLSEDVWPWYTGARGEIEVGRILRRLPPEWVAFHSLPIGNRETDIDHVVVGPAGVFTINTKRHHGKNVWVAGRKVQVAGQSKSGYIPAAEQEAAKIANLLGTRMSDIPPTRPVIAVVAASKLTIKSKPPQVTVIDACHLSRWLRKQKTVLTTQQQARVVEILDDPTLWPSRPVSSATDASARFAALEREVMEASVVRAAWKLGGIGISMWAAISFLPALATSLIR